MKRFLEFFKTDAIFSDSRERGVSTTEYAIMLVLIALAVVSAGGSMGIDEAVVGVFTVLQRTLLS